MSGMNYIPLEVQKLIEKHDTRDPFKLCKALEIKIRYKDLGHYMKAYFYYQSRIKSVYIYAKSFHKPIRNTILIK